jgi:hypothetical protein
MDINRFLNQQAIERYSRLLEIISDETQRRQISNLLEEEKLLRDDANGDATALCSDRSRHRLRGA